MVQLQLQALYGHLLLPAPSPSAPFEVGASLPGLQETAPDEGVDHTCLVRTFMKSIQGCVTPPGPCVSGRIVTEPLASTGVVRMVRSRPGAAESHPDWTAKPTQKRQGPKVGEMEILQCNQKPGFSHARPTSYRALVLRASHSHLAPFPSVS